MAGISGTPGNWIRPNYKAFNFKYSLQKVYCSKCRKYVRDYYDGMIFCPYCGDAKFNNDPITGEILLSKED